MGSINLARVVIGGLVAGVVLNVGGYLANEVLFAESGAETLARLGLEEPAASAIAIFVVLSFVIGIVLAWLYAAIRPRLGAGFPTAIVAGLTAWFFVSLVGSINFAVLGILTTGQATIGAVYDLAFFVVAAIAGAWLYQEGGSAST